jgi:hypothetical protein
MYYARRVMSQFLQEEVTFRRFSYVPLQQAAADLAAQLNILLPSIRRAGVIDARVILL